ncbi:hypothetical protein LguiB_028367 [Lonicera macranthoides]
MEKYFSKIGVGSISRNVGSSSTPNVDSTLSNIGSFALNLHQRICPFNTMFQHLEDEAFVSNGLWRNLFKFVSDSLCEASLESLWFSALLEPLLNCRDLVGSPLNLPTEARRSIDLFRLNTGSSYPKISHRFQERNDTISRILSPHKAHTFLNTSGRLAKHILETLIYGTKKSGCSFETTEPAIWTMGAPARYPSTVKRGRCSLLCQASLAHCPPL